MSGTARPTWIDRLGAPALVALAVGAGLVAIALQDLSGSLLVMAVLGVFGLAALTWAPDRTGLLLFGYFVSIPIAISKALSSVPGALSPWLELTLSDLFLVGLAVAWWLQRGRSLRPSAAERRLTIAVALFFGWAWISGAHSEQVFHGPVAALNLSKYFFAYFLVKELVNAPKRLRWVMGGVATGLAFSSRDGFPASHHR